MTSNLVRVLLIEDDEDDYLLVRNLFKDVSPPRFHLDWVDNYTRGLQEISRGRYDVYLLDYQLGPRTGLELLHEVGDAVHVAPIILLTGHGDYKVDMDTMK